MKYHIEYDEKTDQFKSEDRNFNWIKMIEKTEEN